MNKWEETKIKSQETSKSPSLLSLVELTPILIPYFVGFFIFRGLFAIFPIYLQIKLGIEESEVVSIWAIISGIALLVGAITRLPAGIISNKIGRKNAILLAYFCYYVAIISIYQSSSYVVFVFALSTIRFGLNLYAMTGRSVVSVAQREKGLKNGLLQSMVGFGSFFGPLILSFTLDRHSPDSMIKLAFLFIIIDSLFFLISLKLIPILFNLITEGRAKMDLNLGKISRTDVDTDISVFSTEGVKFSIIQFFFIGIIYGLITSIYTIYGYNVLNINLSILGVIVGVSSGLHVIVGPLAGKYHSKYDEVKIKQIIWLGLVIASVIISGSRVLPILFILGYFVMTISNSAFFTIEITRLGTILNDKDFSIVFGTASSFVIFGTALASYSSPLFYQILPEGTFILSIFISIILYVIALNKRKI